MECKIDSRFNTQQHDSNAEQTTKTVTVCNSVTVIQLILTVQCRLVNG